MATTTVLYLELQQIYRQQADKELTAVERHLHECLTSIGCRPSKISRATLRNFCKNARHLR